MEIVLRELKRSWNFGSRSWGDVARVYDLVLLPVQQPRYRSSDCRSDGDRELDVSQISSHLRFSPSPPPRLMTWYGLKFGLVGGGR